MSLFFEVTFLLTSFIDVPRTDITIKGPGCLKGGLVAKLCLIIFSFCSTLKKNIRRSVFNGSQKSEGCAEIFCFFRLKSLLFSVFINIFSLKETLKSLKK